MWRDSAKNNANNSTNIRRTEHIHQRAIEQFARLGYDVLAADQEENGLCSVTGRQQRSDVVLLPVLRDTLHRLNPDCDDDIIERAIQSLTEGNYLRSMERANEQVYTLLKDGIKLDLHGNVIVDSDEGDDFDGEYHTGKVSKGGKGKKSHKNKKDKRNVKEAQSAQETHRTLQVIDWREAENNVFTLVSHFWLDGTLGKQCLDLVAFVNGLPFVVFAIADAELETTFGTLQRYKETLPSLFWYNAFLVVADAFSCKMGSLTAPFEQFAHWKRVHDEREPANTRLDTLIEGTCQKQRLLDIVENFTLFEKRAGASKLVARNHQYLGVNNAIASLLQWEQQRQELKELRERGGEAVPLARQHGKLGVFWHTQGSGKSYSMVFFVRKVQRTIGNSYTFVVVTDRKDLDDQIYRNFLDTSTIAEPPKEIHARNAKHLKQLLQEKHLLLFTLIQKFYKKKERWDYEEISRNENIIVMADEAHRTQYDTLAQNMRIALPRASFIGFTGTPLMDEEQQTRETFGQYVSIYNFRRAIDDGVTVSLYYENHTPQLEPSGEAVETFEDAMTEIIEEPGLSERGQQKVIDQYMRSENFIAKSELLDNVAHDIITHFANRGYQGKAMVVSINKSTAVRTYNRVLAYKEQYLNELRAQFAQTSDAEMLEDLSSKITYLEQTDMAVVVSADEGDKERFEKISNDIGEPLDIMPHHQRFKEQKLDEDFKNDKHPLRIVFVCAMWMTGFDVPCLSTIYLHRRLEGHTLMQTIARANRVYGEKQIGLIVDYGSNVHALKQALDIYAREDSSGYAQGDSPIGDKSVLINQLRQHIAEASHFCQQWGIDVQHVSAKIATIQDRREQKRLLLSEVDKLVVFDDVKKQALFLTSQVSKTYKAILPDSLAQEFTPFVHLFEFLKDGIYDTMRVDVRHILGQVTKLVQESLEIQERVERISADTQQPRGGFDVRDVNLDALRTRLQSGHRHIEAERVRQNLEEYIRRKIEINPGRVHYMEKLQRAINRYNDGSANIAIDPPMIDPQENIMLYPVHALEEDEQGEHNEHEEQDEQDQRLDEYDAALIQLTGELAQEEQRAEQEGLSEQALAIFDMLTRNLSLDDGQREQVRNATRHIVEKLQLTLTIPDWQKNPFIRDRIPVAIEDELFSLPALYDAESRKTLCNDISLYIREHYKDGATISVA